MREDEGPADVRDPAPAGAPGSADPAPADAPPGGHASTPESVPDTPGHPFAGMRTRTVIPWMIIGTVLLIAVFHVAAWITPLDLSGESASELAAMAAGYTALLTWVLWICKRSGVGLRQLAGRPPAGSIWLTVPALLVVAMIFSIGSWFLFAYALSLLAPGVLEFLLSTMEVPAQQSFAYQAGMFVIVVIAAPVLEEISFRGLLLNRWGYKWGLGKALIITSLVFGILHANPVGITVIGLVAAILYIQTGSLIAPIVLHALNNLVATFIGYFLEWSEPLESSGGPLDMAAEIEWIRASGLTGVVLVAVTLPAIVWYLRRHWPGKDAAGPYVAGQVKVVGAPGADASVD